MHRNTPHSADIVGRQRAFSASASRCASSNCNTSSKANAPIVANDVQRAGIAPRRPARLRAKLGAAVVARGFGVGESAGG